MLTDLMSSSYKSCRIKHVLYLPYLITAENVFILKSKNILQKSFSLKYSENKTQIFKNILFALIQFGQIKIINVNKLKWF